MKFYKLTYPDYETDQHHNKLNPVALLQDLAMPGVTCDLCGSTWSGVRRTYLPVTDPALREPLSDPWPIPWRDRIELADTVRRHLSLPENARLEPGEVLGEPVIELKASRLMDITDGFPGQVLVSERVVSALQAAGITGYKPVQMTVKWRGKGKAPEQMPALYELMVTGRAWREGVNPESVTLCPQCKRTEYPRPYELHVDESRWDGSDFFNVDRNNAIVLVTSRVCDLFAEKGFSNYECAEFPEGVAQRYKGYLE